MLPEHKAVTDIATKMVEKGFEEFHKGNFHDAEELFEQFSYTHDAKIGLSMILYNAGKTEAALEALDGLDSAEAWGARCSIHKTLGIKDKLRNALATYYDKTDGKNWQEYAKFLIDEGCFDEAISVLKKKEIEYSYMLLADCYIHKSELDKARNILTAILNENKNCVAAAIELTNIATSTADVPANIISELLRLSSSRATSLVAQTTMMNCLGKMYEFEHDFENAAVYYSKFVEDKSSELVTKDMFKNRIIPEDIFKTYTSEFVARVPSSDEHCPLVFVMGMPRSGTTLIEQTLVAHPDIATRGETTGISEVIDDIQQQKVVLNSPEEALAYYKDKFDIEWDETIVLDKMPGNFHYLGLIYQLFPNAKFIYSRRNPLDNCVACMTTPFRQGHPYAKFADQTAIEYANHLAFIEGWKNVLPEGTICEVVYEDNVADHEATTKQLLNFLGLPFHSDCEEFYNVKRDVKTASLSQVVKPIYNTSIGRGRRIVDGDVDGGVFKTLAKELSKRGLEG